MNSDQITAGLQRAFVTERHRIVFWYDAEQDFGSELEALELGDVVTLNMAEQSAFAVKLLLELEDTEKKYLLYFPYTEPEPQEDWLLDIKLYSRSFYADRISIIFNELGLQRPSLRSHLVKRSAFLASRTRVDALKRWIQPDCNEMGLDQAMIASLVKPESSDLPQLIFSLAEQAVAQDCGLDDNPSAIAELMKFELLPSLLELLRAEIGFDAGDAVRNGEAEFRFGHFLVRLLVTGFCESIGDVPSWAETLAIPSASAHASARALLSRWRDSSRHYSTFDEVSEWVADAVRLDERLPTFDCDQLVHVATFEVVEKQLIKYLVRSIPAAQIADFGALEKLIAVREDGYWASRHKSDNKRYRYRKIYTALAAAIDLFRLRKQHPEGFHYGTSALFLQAYQESLYGFDTAYRKYCAATNSLELELLIPLDEAVEQCYSHWFIDAMARRWGELLEAEDRLADWRMPSMSAQQDFYAKHVLPLRDDARRSRVVVIISDAFRYEAAVELRDRINEKAYNEASLKSQLGVLPSYTTLGMAALLPHSKLEYRQGVSDDVFVDGRSSKGTIARNKILSDVGGLAVTAEEVQGWSRDVGRDKLKGQQLVYVYHNKVDAVGDTKATESGTFAAVEDAIVELTELARKFTMHFNTSTVLITADHGFLFQQGALTPQDKTALVEKPDNLLKAKKRYVIGQGLPAAPGAWRAETANTAGTACKTDFWIPKGANRFHFVGGARFIHGGAMPQEITVPIVTVRQLRGSRVEQRAKRKVGVISLKSTLRMVNNIQTFALMQTEAVSERVRPITVAVGIYEAGNLVSSEETVTFDCETDLSSEREKSVRLSLAGGDYDMAREYFFVIRDKDLDTELDRYRVVIDLAFTDDFF